MNDNDMWIVNPYSYHSPQNIPDMLKLNTHRYTHTHTTKKKKPQQKNIKVCTHSVSWDTGVRQTDLWVSVPPEVLTQILNIFELHFLPTIEVEKNTQLIRIKPTPVSTLLASVVDIPKQSTGAVRRC